jgi:RNA polymerase sigma-70 factor, ECF subfamily
MFLLALHSESEWIDGIRAGEERAFRQLFDRYYTVLAAFAAEHVGSYDAGREIAQEVFIKIWQKRIDWQPSALGLKTYLYRAVYNQCLNYLKKESTRKKYEEQSGESFSFAPVSSDSSAMEHELMSALEKAVKQLPKRRQMVFVLHRQHDMSIREVAEVLNITPKTAENQMGLALRDLRVALQFYLK